MTKFNKLSDLHAHLGGSTDLKTLYDIAVHRGMRLPVKSYNEFMKMYLSKNPIKSDVYHCVQPDYRMIWWLMKT